jgi:Nif-specific regulatory protein
VISSYGVERDQFLARPGQGVVGRVVESGRPIVVPRVRHDPMALSEFADPAEWAELPWCLVTAPIRTEERVLGAVSAYFRHPGTSGMRAQVELVEVLASLTANALGATNLSPELGRSPSPAPTRRPRRTVFEYANMIGSSTAMRQVYEQVGQVARTNATVLLRGESGTGKELVAHAIHHHSMRGDMPFVKVNCAALPEQLFESEIFGHERGAFTGAHARKKGRFELAEGGSLFLDEIGEISITTQAKLLRVLQYKEYERVGGEKTLKSDVRIVAATNKNMEEALQAGTFREDLYYRMNVFSITLPSLRHRRADIPALAEYFLAKYAAEHERRITRISDGAMDLLTDHAWPGNVRELENVIERAVVVCDGSVVREQHLPASHKCEPEATQENLTLPEAIAQLERKMISEALGKERGNLTRAARLLGTSERVIRYKVNKYGLDVANFRN